MNQEDYNRAKAVAESYTERFLVLRIGLPAPFTFVTESALWALACYGALKLFM